MIMTRCSWLLLLVMFWPMSAEARIFFETSFETPLTTEGFTTGSCGYLTGGSFNASDYPNGCNPRRTTEMAYSGSYSLLGDYTQSPCPGGDLTGNCGVWIDHSHPAVSEVYTRFRYRTVNFTYNSQGGGTKHFYHKSSAGGGPESILMHYIDGTRQFWWNVTSVSGGGPNGILNNPVYYAPNGPVIPTNNDQWYCGETHVRLNTPGVADGQIEIWIDGVRVMNIEGPYTKFRGTDASKTLSRPDFLMDVFRLYVQLGNGKMYYDDVAVGDTRIGCNGPPTETAPAAPTELLVAELMRVFDELPKALLSAWQVLMADAQVAVDTLWSWLGPAEAFAETAAADRLNISWTNAQNLPAGAKLEISLSAFWLKDDDQNKVIATVDPVPNSLVYQIGTVSATATDRWLCIKGRYKVVSGAYGQYSADACNQLAKPIVIPEPPAPPVESTPPSTPTPESGPDPVPVPQQRMTIKSSETTVVDTKLTIEIDRDDCPNGVTSTSKTFDADGKAVSATDPTWKKREVYVTCK